MNALVTEILVYISSFPEHIETQAIFYQKKTFVEFILSAWSEYKIKPEDNKA